MKNEFPLIYLRPCQHDNAYMDGRSQIKVHTLTHTDTGSQRSIFLGGHPSKY